MGIKYIFWDNDGVLVDTEGCFFRANQELCGIYGFDFTLSDFRKLILEKAVGPWEKFREKGFSEDEILKLKEKRDSIYNELILNEKITVDGVEKILKEFSSLYKMAVVTSSKRSHFETIHNRTGFLKYFEFSLTIEDYERCKPAKDPYIKALKVMGAEPEKSIVIEDSKRGLTAALEAGLRCVVIKTELTKGQDFKGAYKVIDNIKELPYLLERIES